ncbi:MAG: hypothetical protein ABSD75_07500 [Terriglobales bacterium]|jgi:hypothetical protein
MATGTAPGLDPKASPPTESTETGTAETLTLRQRIEVLFRQIFAGHEEYLGWHQ